MPYVVLPPSGAPVPSVFQNTETNSQRYDDLLAQMQRLRGQAYLKDGAIRHVELTVDGRHKVNLDRHSWHVLSLDEDGQVVACLRYVEESHAMDFEDLWVRHAALSRCPVLGAKFRCAVELAMRHARQMQIGFGGVGGWAVAEHHRWTIEPLRIILATYGLLQVLCSSCGVSTATMRHGSADILRRIGLSSLLAEGEAPPPYYDPHYSCQMEGLHFDSRFPNPKYHKKVLELSSYLTSAPVICREKRVTDLDAVLSGLDGQPVPAPLIPSFAASA